MRKRTTIAALATITMALALIGWLGTGGSAAPTPARPSKQELAKKLLATKGLELTPAARAFVGQRCRRSGAATTSVSGGEPMAAPLRTREDGGIKP